MPIERSTAARASGNTQKIKTSTAATASCAVPSPSWIAIAKTPYAASKMPMMRKNAPLTVSTAPHTLILRDDVSIRSESTR